MKSSPFDSETLYSTLRKHVFAFLTLPILVCMVYSASLDASWHLDDQFHIVDNNRLHLSEISWANIKKIIAFSPSNLSEGVVFFRPVSNISLAINYYMGGDNVLGYHLFNLFVHVMATLFLYLVLHHSLNLPLLREKYQKNSFFIAMLATVFWSLNPMQTEAVTYVVQRMTSMAAMFFILAMYFYIKGKTANPHHFRKILFFILSGLSGVLAFGSKENAVMLPLSLIFFDLLFIAGPSRYHMKKKIPFFLFAIFLPLGVCVLFFFLAGGKMSSLFSLYDIRPFTPWERLITQSRIILFYMGLLLYPVPTRLSLDHDLLISSSIFDPPTTILSIILICAMIAFAIYTSRSQPLLAFSILFFLLNQLIESSILPLELAFEHRNYLPSMFFFIPPVLLLSKTWDRFSGKRALETLLFLFAIMFIIGLGNGTFLRNLAWKTEESLWISTIENYPLSTRAHHNLGMFYQIKNMDEMAVKEYLVALKGKTIHFTKEKALTYYNLGLLAQKYDNHQTALTYYRNATEIDPCCPGVHNHLAVLLGSNDENVREVHEELLKAIACDHFIEKVQAYSNLGVLLIKLKKPDDAIEVLHKALADLPDHFHTLVRLGYAYKDKGQWGKAFLCFNKAFHMYPKNIGVILFLSEIYFLSGNMEKMNAMISYFIDVIDPAEFMVFCRGIESSNSIFSLSPSMRLLYPLLMEAYQNRYVHSMDDLKGFQWDF